MKNMRLNRSERAIERALLRGEYRPVKEAEFNRIVEAVARRKRDAVLTIRVNSADLASLKEKARRMGIPYQSFVSELIHQYSA